MWILDAIKEHVAMIKMLLNELVIKEIISNDSALDAREKLNELIFIISPRKECKDEQLSFKE